MTSHQFDHFIRQQRLDAVQRLYALILFTSYGLPAVQAWLRGEAGYSDPERGETVFTMRAPKVAADEPQAVE